MLAGNKRGSVSASCFFIDAIKLNSVNQKELKKCPFYELFMVPREGFDPNFKPGLRLRILKLLQSNGSLSLREICSELNETDDHRVGLVLKHLWKKQLVLRTKKAVFLPERVLRGRKGPVNHTRAVNYYA